MESPMTVNPVSPADTHQSSTAAPGAPGQSGVASDGDPDRLQRNARRHLWMHFARMGSYDEQHAIPVIARGEGCYVYDEHGKRYLDALSALYCVNVGYGRQELVQAAAEQMAQLPFFTNWSYAHPPSIELAARVASLAPGNLNRVFFTSGGSEAVETAWKLAKAYFHALGEHNRHKLISRKLAYHGTSMGALTATGLQPLRTPFEPLTPGGHHVPNTNSYRWPEGRDPLWAADAIEEAILFEGPETVAAVILEPVQNGGGCFVPQEGYFQRVREICDRYGVLLISDEVICSWARLGHWFGCERFGYQPDMITTAKGISSAYAALGAVIAGDHTPSRSCMARQPSATASPSADTRSPARWGWPTCRSSSARGCVSTSAPTRGRCARCSSRWATCRSWEMSAARATSRRSSWSRTRTPRRPSPTLRPSSCCGASSPGSSTSVG